MNVQEQSESIDNQRQCSNAKPPINHDIKYAEEADIRDQVAKFLASGREINIFPNSYSDAKKLTYAERNRSTFGIGVKV